MIQTLHGKLVHYNPILVNHRYVELIIVSKSPRRSVFIHFHAGNSGGHMGEYKTLYIMRLKLFWHKLREYVKQWVEGCVHCVSYNVWRTRKQELHFLGQ